MRKICKMLFTGKDNKTFDIARVLWAVSTITFLGISILAVIQHQSWNAMDFGAGISAILFGGGAGIGLKAHSEPDDDDDDECERRR